MVTVGTVEWVEMVGVSVFARLHDGVCGMYVYVCMRMLYAISILFVEVDYRNKPFVFGIFFLKRLA